MEILIFEDSEFDQTILKERIDVFFASKKYDYSITFCSNSEYLYNNLIKFDLIFLDIELEKENGIDIGLNLREMNSNIRIIITSKSKKYLIDGYKIRADRYMLKPINQVEFNTEFENIVEEYFLDSTFFNDEKISPKTIYVKDIFYIEFIGRKSRIHFTNLKEVDTPYTLQYWEEKLKNLNFGKPHRSFLINLKYVSSYSNDEVVLVNEEKIPLSRGFRHSFYESYLDNLHKTV